MKKCEHNNLTATDGGYRCKDCSMVVTERNGRKFQTEDGPRFCKKHGAYGFIDNPFKDCEFCHLEKEGKPLPRWYEPTS